MPLYATKKCIILPRQARDRHRESTHKRGVFFLQGHWIVPSLQDGPAKLEAVAKAITAHKQRRESYWAAAATQTQQLKTDDDD
eukprot:COSAG06_NODE_10920_length_1595_cov_56.041444_1_plen_82_part_10